MSPLLADFVAEVGPKQTKSGIWPATVCPSNDPEQSRSIVGRRLVAGSACEMQRVDTDRDKVHQHSRSQERARNALTDQEEGHSLNHHQDRANDYAWNRAEGDE